MPSQHRANPVTFRPPEDDRVWLAQHAADTGQSVGAVLTRALQDYRRVPAAERAFLNASIAVWREIDRLDSRPGGYQPTEMDVQLRQVERAAWSAYRDLLTPEPSTRQP